MLESLPQPPAPPTREELEDAVLAWYRNGNVPTLDDVAQRLDESRPQDTHSAKSGRSTVPGVVVEPSQPSPPVLPRRVRTRLTPEETTDALRHLKTQADLEDCEMVEAHQERDGEWGLLAALRRWLTASDALDAPASWLEACEEYDQAGEALEFLARKILL